MSSARDEAPSVEAQVPQEEAETAEAETAEVDTAEAEVAEADTAEAEEEGAVDSRTLTRAYSESDCSRCGTFHDQSMVG